MSTATLHIENKKVLIPQLRFSGFDEQWKVKNIGSIAELTSSKRVYLTDYVEKGIPFYRGKEITELKLGKVPNDILYITESSYFEFKEKFGVPQKDDLLITAVGTLGNVLRIKDEAKFYFKDGNLIWFRKITEFSPFLEMALDVYKSEIEKTSIGSTQRALTMVELRKLKFPFPSLPEQQKIASFLIAVDEKIQQLSRKKELLQQYKKGVMQQLFSGKLRFKDENGKAYADWEEKKLGEYLIKYDEKATENKQFPVLTSSRRGLYFQKDYFNGQDVASSNTTGYNVVPRGYFTYRHMSDDTDFKFNINNLCDKGIVSTLYPVFTTKENLDDTFLVMKLNNGKEFQNYAILQKQGGSRTYMYFKKLEKLVLRIPSLKEQQKIAAFLLSIDVKIENTNLQINQTQSFKKGLLQQMFV